MGNSLRKVRVTTLREKKRAGVKIVSLTAHDALSAAVAQAAEVDVILVGDSLGMTALGFPTTLSVTMEMMLHHSAAVARAASQPLLIADMPFMTYKINPEQALTNASRFIQEAEMEAVKVEGGVEIAPTIQRIVDAGVPVMAHIGMLPQSVHAQGGYRVQGREEDAARRLMADAKAVEEAGAFSVVLECVSSSLAAEITRTLSIPTIGIGSGTDCDGQILVFADLLGMSDQKVPKFARKYANLRDAALEAINRYAAEVRTKQFPAPENVYD